MRNLPEKESPPQWRRTPEEVRDRLLHFGLQVCASLEFHHLLGSNLNLFAGLGVAAFARSTLGDAEGTEANEGNALTFLQRFGGAGNEGVQCTLRIGFGNLRIGGNRLDHAGFVQAHVGWVLSLLLFVNSGQMYLEDHACQGFPTGSRKNVENIDGLLISAPAARPQ